MYVALEIILRDALVVTSLTPLLSRRRHDVVVVVVRRFLLIFVCLVEFRRELSKSVQAMSQVRANETNRKRVVRVTTKEEYPCFSIESHHVPYFYLIFPSYSTH